MILDYCWLILMLLQGIFGLDHEITVSVDAGKRYCFFETVNVGEVIDLEYQVIDGGHGDLDISFSMMEPQGRILHLGAKKQEQNVQSEAQLSGDYEFCFDNSFSTYNSKTVFFELLIDRDQDAWDSDANLRKNGLLPEDVYELKVQDIEEVLNTIRIHITKVRHLQELLKSFEARDRNVAEENYFKVNMLSIAQLLVMLLVGLIQVVMLKSLFDNTSTAHKLWKKLHLQR